MTYFLQSTLSRDSGLMYFLVKMALNKAVFYPKYRGLPYVFRYLPQERGIAFGVATERDGASFEQKISRFLCVHPEGNTECKVIPSFLPKRANPPSFLVQ